MAEQTQKPIDDEAVEVAGKVVSMKSIIRLNVKTAMWILGIAWAILGTIGTYGYFNMKAKIDQGNAKIEQQKEQIMDNVSKRLDNVTNKLDEVRLNQESMKGDMKVILDRENRSLPVVSSVDKSVSSPIPIMDNQPPTTVGKK